MFGKLWQYISSLWRLPDPPSSPPRWEPAAWSHRQIRFTHNCVAYACNSWQPDREEAPQLGGRFGLTREQMRTMNVQQFIFCAEKEGLKRVFRPVAEPGHYIVALAVTDKKMEIPPEKQPVFWEKYPDEYWDAHCWRFDRDGKISHKEIPEPPSRLDADGNPITDPKTCARGLYRHFIGWFQVPDEGIPLKPLQDNPLKPLLLPQPKFR